MTDAASFGTRNRSVVVWIMLFGLVAFAIIAWFSHRRWMPTFLAFRGAANSERAAANSVEGHDRGQEHEHEHAAATTTLVLSDQARQNLGLTVGTIEPRVFWKQIVVPGQVTNLPGHSERRINAMVQGTILKVHVLQGQTVRPGDPLMDVQVTSELLASAQSNLLRILQDLELNQAEIKRLAPVSESGAVSPKLLLEKEYEKRRLESARQVQLQELTIRGLTAVQVRKIIDEKSLIRQFTIYVPDQTPSAETDLPEKTKNVSHPQRDENQIAESRTTDSDVLVVEQLDVFPGKLVNPGDELCGLAMHDELQIRGEAFETESRQIYRALTEHWPISAEFDLGEREPVRRDNLFMLYVSGVTNPQARSFDFFIPLRNEVLRDFTGPDGRSYRSWCFRPGQRAQLLVPVEKWSDRFVVPSDAVVTEGADSYCFKVNGALLERQSVAIDYRDARQTVIANDGTLFQGDEIAMNQAYSLNLALKKSTGSGVDLHAGHNH